MLIAVAVVEYEDRILFLKRNKDPFKGILTLPGGKIDKAETPKSAIVRELFEETGLNVDKIKQIGFFDEKVYEDEKIYHHEIFIFHIVPTSFYFSKSAEGDLFDLSKNELLSHEGSIVPSDFRMLQRYLDGETSFRARIATKGKSGNYEIIRQEDY